MIGNLGRLSTVRDLHAFLLAKTQCDWVISLYRTPPLHHRQAARITDPYYAYYDGIFGLALEAYLGTPPLINALGQGLIDEPLLTMWLSNEKPSDDSLAGQLTIGGADYEHCSPDFRFNDLLEGGQFYMPLDHISVGKSTIGKHPNWKVISDTGSSHLNGPKTVMDKIAKAIGAEIDGDDYVISCNATMPHITFEIGGWPYTIAPHEYIGAKNDDHCTLLLNGISEKEQQNTWVLGGPFTRAYCQIYDIGKKRVGFSKSLPLVVPESREITTVRPVESEVTPGFTSTSSIACGGPSFSLICLITACFIWFCLC
ncbi:hypothetical protein QR680_004142 [Steinernema hermaphroditum]|uniref:Peptidase A1 domain-containing protein n=1 Tax=Steinernema hermaphroditum TaxID=289476 RepID=A0AA39HNU2_9BILA|nr:hypothetical protein QR680_004142 [Steinernema hermaphroditum]